MPPGPPRTDPWADLPWSSDSDTIGLSVHVYYPAMREYYEMTRDQLVAMGAGQSKRARLWLNGGSCIRLRPLRPNHVWSYEFVADRTHDGKAFRILCIIDEFTREAPTIPVARKNRSTDVIEALADLFILRGVPTHIRSDNGPEFVA